ncbi:hypothetical protein SAY86_018177 [Trapa natans]|uniref:Uncharacterized protein n=1 Tax=Trapa natans TaxID=22666 RepID=A0AAN7LGE4_TRANT|nr:hypothetical protein SAY86_018177 [Trapa natans]
MTVVWMFESNGMFPLVKNPQGSWMQGGGGGLILWLPRAGPNGARLGKVLQFHNRNSIDLISLPSDFIKFNSVYMYDIVVKNHNIFRVGDI